MVSQDSLISASFDEHGKVLAETEQACGPEIVKMLDVWVSAIQAGKKLLFFGNGGSAGDAQHLATELTVRFSKDRPPIAAIALTTDTSALTAIGNDLGFEHLFARQVQALGQPGDVAVGISTSGRSPNVITGLKAAHSAGLTAVALTGCGGGDLAGLADPLIIVPSDTTARIQEMHILIGQILCEGLERELGLV